MIRHPGQGPLLVFLIVFSLWASPTVSGSAISTADPQEAVRSAVSQPSEQIDLAETVLQISRHWQPSLDLDRLRGKLDALTDKVKRTLGENPTPQQTVDTLSTVIHEVEGYEFTSSVDAAGMPTVPSELFMHGLLEHKRGYCMNLSLLYLIVGNRLNLPLYGVPLPNHFFVRYESPEYRVNIETTQGGTRLPDSYYRDRFGVTEDAPYYMTNLNSKQTLGAYFSNVGLTFYRNEHPEEAVFYLTLSTEINPKSIDALNNLGNIYSELEQFDKAVEQYKKALEADPDNLSSLFNLGLVHAEAGRTDKAVEVFLQVAERDPGFPAVHDILSRLYLEKENYISALLHTKILDRLQPRQFETRIRMGNILLGMEEFELALGVFEWVQNAFPARLEVNERMGEVYYRMGEYDKSIVQYEYIIERAPKNLPAYVQLGWVHYRKGNLDKAVDWTQRGLKNAPGENPFTTLAHMNMGFYHVLKQDYKTAREWYRKAFQTEDPKAVEGMIEDIQEAKKEYPDLAELEFFAGWILFENGRRDEAHVWLKSYLTARPEGPFAEEAKNMLDAIGQVTPAGMVEVPEGYFIMGSDHHGGDEAPRHKVFLDTFYIDKHEVSAAEFAEFLNAMPETKKFYAANKYGVLVNRGGFVPRRGLENYPANNVSWFGAAAYCEWKDKRLPTEAEWEKAARGPDGFLFPWGDDPVSPKKSRYKMQWTEEIQHHVMVPVDSMPEGRSPYGVFHMLGNVKEWVDDWYDREYYKEESHKINPKGQIGGEYKVLKGGSWRDLRSFLYASFRNNSHPGAMMEDYGFRCAWSTGTPEIQAPKQHISFEPVPGPSHPAIRKGTAHP